MIKFLQNIPLGYYAFSGLVNFLTAFVISLIVFFSDKKSKANRIFAIFSLSVAYWSLLYFIWLITKNKEWAEFYLRSCMIGVLFMPSLFIHFVVSFLNLKINKKFIVANYILSILVMFTIYSPLYARDIGRHLVFPYWLHTGPIFHVALIHFGAVVLYSFYLMSKPIKKEKGTFRNQILYVFIGTAVGYISGVTNFFCWYRIKIPPFLNIFVSVYVIMVAIAVLRYRLMDINIALTRAGIFVVVYLFVLGIPFVLGYKYGQWQLATWVTVILASAGPFIFLFLQRRAEARMRKEEFHARDILKQAAEGMMHIPEPERLINLITHVTTKTLKLENAAMFLLNEQTNKYNLSAVRLKSKYNYLETLDSQDVLIQKLSQITEPLVYEEIKIKVQELKDETTNPIHEILSQMEALSAKVIVPALSRDKLLGFLVLGERKSRHMYSKDDLSLLQLLSYQAALAIENAQFHQKAQEEALKEDRKQLTQVIAHGASHQFHNVLNALITHSEGKLDELSDLDFNTMTPDGLKNTISDLQKKIEFLAAEARRGTQVVEAILSLGSKGPLKLEQGDLNAIIQSSLLATKLKQTKIDVQNTDYLPTEVVFNPIDNLPKIWCNPLYLEQAINNMLDNGFEAVEERKILMKAGDLPCEDNYRGRIVITTGVIDNHVFLKIQDNGIGIKSENKKDMFTPFFTTKGTGRYSKKGHGIGTYVIQTVIEKHHAKMHIAETAYGKGTTFLIEFPLRAISDKQP